MPGKTGFDGLSFGGDPDILITSVQPSGLATLSRPLLQPAGGRRTQGRDAAVRAVRRPHAPERRTEPGLPGNARRLVELRATVCKEAASIFGPEGYDLEVWNELGFGSQFLNSEHYYSSAGEGEAAGEAGEEATGEEGAEAEEGSKALESAETEVEESQAPSKAQVTKAVVKALLDETVAYVRDPANGISPGVGITDGFASQTPFPSGAQAPRRAHRAQQAPVRTAPRASPPPTRKGRSAPLNALGERDTLPRELHAAVRPPLISRCSPSTT